MGHESWEHALERGRQLAVQDETGPAEQALLAAVAQAEAMEDGELPLAASLSALAQLKFQTRSYAEAESLFRRVIALREAVLGADHPLVLNGMNNLAAVYVSRDALDEAEPLLQQTVTATRKRLETAQFDLSVNLNNLVRLYVKRGDYARAEPVVLQLLLMKRPHGPEHPDVAAILVSLARIRDAMGHAADAVRILRRVLAARERTLAAGDPRIAATRAALAALQVPTPVPPMGAPWPEPVTPTLTSSAAPDDRDRLAIEPTSLADPTIDTARIERLAVEPTSLAPEPSETEVRGEPSAVIRVQSLSDAIHRTPAEERRLVAMGDATADTGEWEAVPSTPASVPPQTLLEPIEFDATAPVEALPDMVPPALPLTASPEPVETSSKPLETSPGPVETWPELSEPPKPRRPRPTPLRPIMPVRQPVSRRMIGLACAACLALVAAAAILMRARSNHTLAPRTPVVAELPTALPATAVTHAAASSPVRPASPPPTGASASSTVPGTISKPVSETSRSHKAASVRSRPVRDSAIVADTSLTVPETLPAIPSLPVDSTAKTP